MSLEQLELRLRTEAWSEIALPPDAVLDDLPRIDLSATQAVDWGHGKPVPADHLAEAGAPVRAYDEHGIWRGIGHVAEDGAVIHPAKVIPAE
jgi:tRNA U55 pseudouridine synthase TruB